MWEKLNNSSLLFSKNFYLSNESNFYLRTSFINKLYYYYCQKGYYNIISTQIVNLLISNFMILFIMFLILFRSIKLSLISLFPSILSIGSVLGFMGWASIPLDLMTITIAAISMGIAVDDTIHYVHRFEHEFGIDKNYTESMYRAHNSVGYAMYYTSITVIIGFSILVFSNFIPSIYFGLLTGMAMFIALFASLTLLPQLIIYIQPFGPEKAEV